MASFEVCHVSSHKCNPASKVLGPWVATLFTLLHFAMYRKDTLSFPSLKGKMQKKVREASPELA